MSLKLGIVLLKLRTVVLKQGIVLIPILVNIKHTFQTASVICGTRAYDGIRITIVQ